MPESHEDLFREPGTTGLEDVAVRQLHPQDLDAVVRIDQRNSGNNRREYFKKKLDEHLKNAGIRISLAAEFDGTFAGFVLGRLYYGEFGIPEPSAIIDTIGVEPALRGHHVGRALLHQLETNLHGLRIEKILTNVDWKNVDLIGFFAASDFKPAPVLCLEKNLKH